MGRHYLLLTMILLVSGCAAKYTSPISSPAADQFSTTINRSFDETWQALVNHVSESFFKIDNFEKDSGLITLEFGASDLARYIDCGLWEHVNFNGPYVTYLEHNYGAKLKGRMNISTRIINAQKTEVRVNTRYVLSSEKASDLGSPDLLGRSTQARPPQSTSRTFQRYRRAAHAGLRIWRKATFCPR